MIDNMRSACRAHIEYAEDGAGRYTLAAVVRPHGSTSQSIYSAPIKLSTHDSSQALLPSTSASFDASENGIGSGRYRDYNSGEAGSRRQPMWHGYCIWLITVLLIAAILTLLYLYVMLPIFDHINHQRRKSTLAVTFVTRTTKPHRNNPSTADEFTQLFTISSSANISKAFNYDPATTTGKSTTIIDGFLYTRPVGQTSSTYKPSTVTLPKYSLNNVKNNELNFIQLTTPATNSQAQNFIHANSNTNIDTTAEIVSLKETRTSTAPTPTEYTKPTTAISRTTDTSLSTTSADLIAIKSESGMKMVNNNITPNKDKYKVTSGRFNSLIIRTTTPTTVKSLHTTKASVEEDFNDNSPNIVFENDNDIRPVEISIIPEFLPVLLPPEQPDVSSEAIGKTPEPIWRRLPPNFVAQSPLFPPLPPTPESSTLPLSFSVSASVVTMQRTNDEVEPGSKSKTSSRKANSQSRMFRQRQRRQAPVIVTALLDIGRDRWPYFTRHFDTYLDYFEKLFRLDNFMIIYCELKVLEFIREHVRDVDVRRLQVVELQLDDLPLYRYRDEMQAILDEEQNDWSPHWDRQMRTHPESRYADYNVLVNSKPYLLSNATHISRFGVANDVFVWLDAGYGHGSVNLIPGKLWLPSLPPSLITVIKLTTILEKVEGYELSHVYRKQKAVISGGFLAGGVAAIRRFNTFFFKTFMELLDDRRVDDDQTVLLMTIRNYRRLFNVLHGGWFDVFKLLP